MKLDSTKTKALAMAMATMAAATFAWTGCDSHDEGGHSGTSGSGGHSSPYPACNEITNACHEVDVGEGEIHDCHDKAHAATSDSDCTGIKDRCLQICAEAKVDAGVSGDGGEHADSGQ